MKSRFHPGREKTIVLEWTAVPAIALAARSEVIFVGMCNKREWYELGTEVGSRLGIII